jgi:hypothetical protein
MTDMIETRCWNKILYTMYSWQQLCTKVVWTAYIRTQMRTIKLTITVRIQLRYSQIIKSHFPIIIIIPRRMAFLVFCVADYTSIQETKQKPEQLIYDKSRRRIWHGKNSCHTVNQSNSHESDVNWRPNLKICKQLQNFRDCGLMGYDTA